tara:strand:+ start:12118 stop:13158 length:1041 start_codon:yes stop_codon:yes gene_type:complete
MITFGVRGLIADTSNDDVKTLRPVVGSAVKLVAEPDNKHDKNAVAVYWNNHKLGYVPSIKTLQESSLHYKIGTVLSYGYTEDGGNNWNDEHKGKLGSVKIGLGKAKEEENFSPAVGQLKPRISSILSYLNYTGNVDGLIRWAFQNADSFDGYKNALQKTADKGTEVHKAIECYIKYNVFRDGLDIFDPKALQTYKDYKGGKSGQMACCKDIPEGWFNFMKKYKVRPISMEERLVDSQLGITGQYDMLAYIEHKGVEKVAIIDWKTSKKITDKHRLQCSFYVKTWYNNVSQYTTPVGMVVAFGGNNKQGYSCSIVDWDEWHNYYIAVSRLKDALDILGVKFPMEALA